MANVTDPLARAVHGTNPQNLIEYITRQKIYDSLYWKEECFGLSASDVATKASELKALGGSYGGNNKPTRFLCLALKLLQIQPEEGIVEEFLQNEDFKYVRALGAFYLRLTGRPAEIYEQIEPLYNDFRKLRLREPTGWKLTYMDELADDLLTSDRYCGIALPHLPKRSMLLSAGYFDGPRRSALRPLIDEQAGGDAETLLQKMAENGNAAAKAAMDERKKRKADAEEKERILEEERVSLKEFRNGKESDRKHRRKSDDDYYRDRDRVPSRNEDDGGFINRRDHSRDGYDDYRERDHGRNDHRHRKDNSYHRDDERKHENRGYQDERHSIRSRDHRHHRHYDEEHDRSHSRSNRHDKEKKLSSKDEKKYGSLFKKSSSRREGSEKRPSSRNLEDKGDDTGNAGVIEGSEEFWNDQRAKLGLKPLKNTKELLLDR